MRCGVAPATRDEGGLTAGTDHGNGPLELYLQSELGVGGQTAGLLANVCEALKADRYLALTVAAKYIDPQSLGARRIELALVKFRPLLYPQLWGDCRYNLSTLDLLLNCWPKARDIILAASP
jgi:hypothetical protein